MVDVSPEVTEEQMAKIDKLLTRNYGMNGSEN
nr:MAG TPA: hypothetical protein [Bacteriophage sp.]